MTSNEALEVLFNLSPIEEVEEATDCVREIKRDLKVLEILKRHLRIAKDNIGDFEKIDTFTKGDKYQDYAFCNFSTRPEGDFQKEQAEDFAEVKEWLTNDK